MFLSSFGRDDLEKPQISQCLMNFFRSPSILTMRTTVVSCSEIQKLRRDHVYSMITFASIRLSSYLSRYGVICFCTLQTVLLICLFFTFLFQDFDGCDTWLKMQDLLCQRLSVLYKEHGYINDILDDYEKLLYKKIRSCDFEYAVIITSLEQLSKYLRTYHRRRCIVLIDEYDHPLEIAYRNQYYEEARGFFSSFFGALLKVNICYS